jgi:serine/threonine-protein kinase
MSVVRRDGSSAVALARRVNDACERFEAAWRTGDRPSLESFLEGSVEPERSAIFAELLALEVELLRDEGGQPAFSAYFSRFPDHGRIIESVFAQGPRDASGQPTPDSLTILLAGEPGPGPGDEVLTLGSGSESGSSSSWWPQAKVGDYELLEEIARGGMGVVYKARQRSLKRTVALKMILSGQFASPAEMERFRLEAELAANLDHPNIVPIYEVGEHESHHFFSMKLVDGGSLAKEVGRLIEAPRDAARLLATVAHAVHYAHEQGFLHCDLKPANILIDGRGEPHITDFGLAKRVGQSSQTTTGAILGTPSYMAPEQASGDRKEVSPATDVYGLGAILYELLAGRPPFRAPTVMETVVQVLEREPVPPSQVRQGVPGELERICLKCLEKSPKDRYASAAILAENLERYLRGEDVTGTGLPQRLRRWTRREPELVSRVGGLALIAAITQINYIYGRNSVFKTHARVMSVLGAWILTSLFFQLALRRRRDTHAKIPDHQDSSVFFPVALRRWRGTVLVRVAWAATDMFLLTLLLKLLDAMETSLLVGYPLLIAASGLWFRVNLVWVTTFLAEIAYLWLVIDKTVAGTAWKSNQYPNIFMAALAVTGFVVARQVKRFWALSSYYERRPVS